MLNSFHTVSASRNFHTLGSGAVINVYYVRGLNKLAKTREFLSSRKRDPYNQNLDLGPEELQFNIFNEFFANDSRAESKFNFYGFANKISAIIFLITFIFTFRSIILSALRFMINIKKNYGKNSDNYVKRVDNKSKIREEFKKRAMRVANKRYGEPKIYKKLLSDHDPRHDDYVNSLDHYTFSRYNLNDPVYDSTDYIKDSHGEELHIRSEFEDFVNQQANKRREKEKEKYLIKINKFVKEKRNQNKEKENVEVEDIDYKKKEGQKQLNISRSQEPLNISNEDDEFFNEFDE